MKAPLIIADATRTMVLPRADLALNPAVPVGVKIDFTQILADIRDPTQDMEEVEVQLPDMSSDDLETERSSVPEPPDSRDMSLPDNLSEKAPPIASADEIIPIQPPQTLPQEPLQTLPHQPLQTLPQRIQSDTLAPVARRFGSGISTTFQQSPQRMHPTSTPDESKRPANVVGEARYVDRSPQSPEQTAKRGKVAAMPASQDIAPPTGRQHFAPVRPEIDGKKAALPISPKNSNIRGLHPPEVQLADPRSRAKAVSTGPISAEPAGKPVAVHAAELEHAPAIRSVASKPTQRGPEQTKSETTMHLQARFEVGEKGTRAPAATVASERPVEPRVHQKTKTHSDPAQFTVPKVAFWGGGTAENFPLPLAALAAETPQTQPMRSLATPPQATVAAGQIATQLAAAVSISSGGVTHINLAPEELGRVRMVMSVHESSISLVVYAERAEVSELLRRHIDVLAKEFNGLGFEDISFTFGEGNVGGAETAADQGWTASVEEIQPDTTTPEPGHDWAVDAGLDLRI